MVGNRAAEAAQTQLPPPPTGASPTLAFVRAIPVRDRLGSSLAVIAFFAAIAIGFHFFRGLDWLPTLLIFGIGGLVVLQTGLSMTTSAGADWVRVGNRFVSTTSLVKVKTSLTLNGTVIALRDRDGHFLRSRLSYLTDSAEVWQLFQTGLRQSLRSGLEPDTRTRRVLNLGSPSEVG
jgi:hypothetical protein